MSESITHIYHQIDEYSLDRPGFKIKDHKNPLLLKLMTRFWVSMNTFTYYLIELGHEISRLHIQESYQIN